MVSGEMFTRRAVDTDYNKLCRCSMNRLRTELSRLAITQSQKIKSPAQQASFLVGIYDDIIRGLTTGPGRTSHPRLQTELSFFRTREEEAKRRV